MRFWVREIAGWILVGLGLYLFLVCFSLLIDASNRDWLLEAGPLTFIGFVVFRGGIHLLKVATAARVCLQAQAELTRQQGKGERPKKEADAPWDW